MLIGYQFERTAQDDLLIHSRNRVQSAVVLWLCGIGLSLPIAGIVFATSDDSSLLTGMHPLHALLLGIGMLLIPACVLWMLVYTGSRETFVLSRVKAEGQRITRNMFGRRRRVESTFSIQSPRHLELRRHNGAKVRATQLWLVMRDGAEQRLTSQNVPVVPGSQRTQQWLQELADYLQVAVPTDIVEPVASKAATVVPAAAPVQGKKNAEGGKQRKTEASEPPVGLIGPIGILARVVLALLGAFVAVLEMTRVMTVLPAFFTGRLSVSGSRGRPTVYYLMDQPWSFLFNLLFGIGEILLLGFIAWRCLEFAIRGRLKP